MSNENNTLNPAKIELISNVSGAYSALFWDGLREVTGTLDTIRKIRSVLETLYSTDNESEAYNLILAVYDLIAIETPPAIFEMCIRDRYYPASVLSREPWCCWGWS